MIENIHWLGHSSFRIEDEKSVYIDPWRLKGSPPKADLILITHDHHDHCSPDDVAKIAKKDTVIVTIAAVARRLKGDVRIVRAGDSLTAAGIPIEVVPAYNVDKPNHPKSAGHVGFIITMGGQRIYHAGDTDLIPEMDDIQAEIALLPVGGTFTMNAEEAAQAAKKIKPQVAIPIHYGTTVGSIKDAQRFHELCETEVVIPPKE